MGGDKERRDGDDPGTPRGQCLEELPLAVCAAVAEKKGRSQPVRVGTMYSTDRWSVVAVLLLGDDMGKMEKQQPETLTDALRANG